jgi:hypothetical protein
MAVSAENLKLSIIKEATLGITPATPAWLTTAIVSESLVLDATFTESEMITPQSRGVPASELTQTATSGDINRELIYEEVTDTLMEALVGNTWGTDPHGHTITTDELYDYTTIISLSAEKDWDMGGSNNYHNLTGQVPASGSFEFAPGEIITHTTSFVGLSLLTADDPVAGATYTPVSGNPPMSAPRVTSMTLTDLGTSDPVSWMTDACFTNMTLALENNTRALACIGQLPSKEIALGRLNITGSGSLYYSGDEPLNSLLAETEYGLLINAEDSAGNFYKFFMPRCKFTIANVNATGQSTDVMAEITLQVLQEATLMYSIIFGRTTPSP